MWRLVKYLEENEPALSALVESRKSRHELAATLAEIWPGGSKEHEELANAVITVMWLGKRAQEIKEQGDKSAEQFFREAVMIAFETGRRSAITAP
jgi:hypothetical protein